MRLLKASGLDIAVLILIGVSGFFNLDGLFIAIWIYTGLLLSGKVVALLSPSLFKKVNTPDVPGWVYHLLYGATIITLLLFEQRYLAGVWVLIWVLSTISVYKSRESQPS